MKGVFPNKVVGERTIRVLVPMLQHGNVFASKAAL